MIQTDGLLDQLGAADMWLWYDTSAEAADRRNQFRVAVMKIKKSQLDPGVWAAVRDAQTVLASADPVWLKTFRLKDPA